jgi:hypothetical protein
MILLGLVGWLLAGCMGSRPNAGESSAEELPEPAPAAEVGQPSAGSDLELDPRETRLVEEVREPTEAELDALGFKLTGNLRDVAGRVILGRIHFTLTQFPHMVFSDGASVERGSFECDETGAFMVRMPGYRPIDSMPMLVRLSPSFDLLRDGSYHTPVTDAECIQFHQKLYEGERMERIAPRSLSLDLGDLRLCELPYITEVWLNSDEPKELECGIAIEPQVRFGGAIAFGDTGYTLRAGEVLTLYSEVEDRDIWITPDYDSGWAIRESVLPVGSRQGLSVYPTSLTTLIVRKEDHPDGGWWQLIAEDDYPQPPIRPTEQWSWKDLLRFRTRTRGGKVGTSEVFRDLYPQAYKVLVWSQEPTEDGLPIRVIDLELGGEDRRVRVR